LKLSYLIQFLWINDFIVANARVSEIALSFG
jgi:hypothetical protein